MDLQQFHETYAQNRSHERIEIKCDGTCGLTFTPLKTRAQQTIQQRGKYLCRSCGQAYKHAHSPMTDATKLKIGEALQGVPKSEQAKKNMSEAAKHRKS